MGLIFSSNDFIDEKSRFLNNKIEQYFSEYKTLNFSNIKYLLKSQDINVTDEEILNAIMFLLVNEGCLEKKDFWDKESEYTLLDRHYHDSSYSRYQYSFTDDSNRNKTFLLISDTHIGNEELENMKLINKLYDYAIKNGATKCFHLGDLFEGNPNKYKNFKEEFYKQINIFKNEYPKPNPSEMMTYGLIGNHDDDMNEFIQRNAFFYHNDLRKLSVYNPSVYIFPRDKWISNFSDAKFHFSHRLYMSIIIDNLKINEINYIEKKMNEVGNLILDADYDVLVSGHLHKGIIYTGLDYFKKKNKLYLGVPSSSNVNVGGVVGYLVYMYPESNCMEVSILGCDNNLNIYEVDRITWEFNKMNKSYCKTL